MSWIQLIHFGAHGIVCTCAIDKNRLVPGLTVTGPTFNSESSCVNFTCYTVLSGWFACITKGLMSLRTQPIPFAIIYFNQKNVLHEIKLQDAGPRSNSEQFSSFCV